MAKKPDLEAVFRQYNRKYFKNRLKVSAVRFGKCIYSGETTFFDSCSPIITISRTLAGYGRFVRIILLHEMRHVAMADAADVGYGVGHGPKFIRSGRRLVSKGAYDDLI